MTLARFTKSARLMAVLAVLLGLCLGKPPEATRLATSPSFGLTRGASSYMPRKQQRVRALVSRAFPAPSVRDRSRQPEANTAPHRTEELSRRLLHPSRTRVGARAETDAMPHRLRCEGLTHRACRSAPTVLFGAPRSIRMPSQLPPPSDLKGFIP